MFYFVIITEERILFLFGICHVVLLYPTKTSRLSLPPQGELLRLRNFPPFLSKKSILFRMSDLFLYGENKTVENYSLKHSKNLRKQQPSFVSIGRQQQPATNDILLDYM